MAVVIEIVAMGHLARAGLLAAALAVCGCAANVQTVTRPGSPPRAAKGPDCRLQIHPADRRLDPSCQEIGDVFVGDTGLTID